MERIHIKFDGRTPITDSAIISVGVEGDKNATELWLEVPKIVDSQIAMLNMVMGEFNADSLVIPEDGIVAISHDMFDDSGIFKAWVTVTNAGNDTVWQSYAWRMKWEDIPNIEDVLENGNPGILKKMAATIQLADTIEQERTESFSRLKLVASRVEDGVLVEATNVDGTTTSALLADGQGAGTSTPAIDPKCYFTSYSDAEAAAATAQEYGTEGTEYFYGQRLLVFENDRATWYTIQPGGVLTQEGGGAGGDGTGEDTAVEFGSGGSGSTAADNETAVEF